MTRADIIVAPISTAALQYNGGGTQYVVQKNGATSTFYVFITGTDSDFYYTKTTDGGYTWQTPVLIFTGTLVAQSLWYRRWSGLSSDLVDMAYVESGGSDILYRSLDISTDT